MNSNPKTVQFISSHHVRTAAAGKGFGLQSLSRNCTWIGPEIASYHVWPSFPFTDDVDHGQGGGGDVKRERGGGGREGGRKMLTEANGQRKTSSQTDY